MSEFEVIALLAWGGFSLIWCAVGMYLTHKGIIA